MKFKIHLLFLVLFLLGFIGMVYLHESVHKIIFEDYGIDSKIKMFDGWHATTTPLGNYSNCNDNCKLAHNINDIVGYHLIFIYLLIGFSVIFFLKETKCL